MHQTFPENDLPGQTLAEIDATLAQIERRLDVVEPHQRSIVESALAKVRRFRRAMAGDADELCVLLTERTGTSAI